MAIPRRAIVDRESSGFYHCISRCVRRALLCGGKHEHRRAWIEQRMRQLAGHFAMDVAAYAILPNHLHVLVRTMPERVAKWSDREVATRWLRAFPGHRDPLGADVPPSEEAIDALVAQSERIKVLRRRLADLSWFMRALKEPLAHWANKEDDVTGHFWEGRFKSPRVLDPTGLLGTMVYVDLNVIRAGLATTPEQSDYTSIRNRIEMRQRHYKQVELSLRSPLRAATHSHSDAPSHPTSTYAEDGIWLAPIERRRQPEANSSDCVRHSPGLLDLTLDEYLVIVDTTGRTVHPGKSGAIPDELATILDRHGIDSARWLEVMSGLPKMVGTVVGNAASRASEAARRGKRRVGDVMRMDKRS